MNSRARHDESKGDAGGFGPTSRAASESPSGSDDDSIPPIQPIEALRAAMPDPQAHRLLDYWLERRANGAGMPRHLLKPDELVDILPHVYIMDVESDMTRFRCRLTGTYIQERMGRRVDGHFLDDIRHGAVRRHLTALFGTCARAGVAGYGSSALVSGSAPLVTYRRLALPMTTDGNRVDQILGAWTAHYDDSIVDPIAFDDTAYRERPERLIFSG